MSLSSSQTFSFLTVCHIQSPNLVPSLLAVFFSLTAQLSPDQTGSNENGVCPSEQFPSFRSQKSPKVEALESHKQKPVVYLGMNFLLQKYISQKKRRSSC